MKYIYINKAAYREFEELNEILDPLIYKHVGTTWEDFLRGKFVLLSDELVAFHEANPKATAEEVWNMLLKSRTVEKAKREMLDKIGEYNISSNVNGFTVNGEIEGWLTPSLRTNYKASIDAAKLLNVPTLKFFVGETLFNTTPAEAEIMLALIQLYADLCYIITEQHIQAVKALDNVEEIDNFDYTGEYPEKLNFNLS